MSMSEEIKARAEELKDFYTKAILEGNKTITMFDVFLLGYQANILIPNAQYQDLLKDALELKEALVLYAMTNETFPEYGDVAKNAIEKFNSKRGEK